MPSPFEKLLEIYLDHPIKIFLLLTAQLPRITLTYLFLKEVAFFEEQIWLFETNCSN